MEKKVNVNIETSYQTWGHFCSETQQIWLVCHGYGQLAKYFIRRFDVLDPHIHYVIAPQGLSKFYLDSTYQKVGACWLTKENREIDLTNQLNYIDAVWQTEIANLEQTHGAIFEKIHNHSITINILGFSQGCAAACRWAVSRQIPFSNLILWAGLMPKEITKEDIAFLTPKQQVHFVVGKADEFTSVLNFETEIATIKTIIPNIKIKFFEGVHEVKREVLAELVNW
jgi:predicted esterase